MPVLSAYLCKAEFEAVNEFDFEIDFEIVYEYQPRVFIYIYLTEVQVFIDWIYTRI